MKKELNKKGLTREYILALSKKKQEPEWLLELRLKGLEYWNKLTMPKWAPDISELALDDILMYVETGNEMVSSWDEVPKEIKETFDKLGIPEAEQEHLAGVGAQYDSEVIYHNLKERIAKKGVIYLPMEEAIQLTKKKKEEVIAKYGVDVGGIVREHFMKLISEKDHKFAALHAAVWSGGSFIYIPKRVSVEIPIQSYYRLNAPGAGQFEHTLIVVDEDSDLHFIEGCSAPKYTVSNLHAGSVELYVKKNSRLKFSTVESWSKNVFNAKSLSSGGGVSMTRTLAKITKKALRARSYTDCKSLILDNRSVSNAIPEVKVECNEAEVSHEASVGKISDEAVYYLQTRGVSEDEARALIVRGFTGDVSKELPIEYAMEMNNLIRMEMEGTA